MSDTSIPVVSPIDARDGLASPAEKAVGRAREGDTLAPRIHAAELPAEAGALARLLSAPAVAAIEQEYDQFDAIATSAQKKFRRMRGALRGLAAIAALAGGAALVLQIALGYVSDIQLLAVGVHVVALFLLILVAWRLDAGNPRRRWKSARAEAEWRRIRLFSTLLEQEPPAEPAPGELPLGPLLLAYFRRYQLELQIRYFERAPLLAERSFGAARWLTLVAFLAGLAALVFGGIALGELLAESGVQLPGGASAWAARDLIASFPWALGVVGFSSLFAVLAMQTETSEIVRDSTRYRSLARNLGFLREFGYDDVRQAVEAGDLEAMRGFVELVHSRLRAEVEEWLAVEAAPATPAAATFGVDRPRPSMTRTGGVPSSTPLPPQPKALGGATASAIDDLARLQRLPSLRAIAKEKVGSPVILEKFGAEPPFGKGVLGGDKPSGGLE